MSEGDTLDVGDIVWADFDPRIGRGQSGHRPAIVMSDASYHALTNMAIVCPITSTVRPWPTRITLPEASPVKGQVLVDHIKSIDREARHLRKVGTVGVETVSAVRGVLARLLDLHP